GVLGIPLKGGGPLELPQKRLTMRKLKEVLLLHSLGLSQHQIARSCFISQSTVHEYLAAAQAAEVRWPLPGGSYGVDRIRQAAESCFWPPSAAPLTSERSCARQESARIGCYFRSIRLRCFAKESLRTPRGRKRGYVVPLWDARYK